MKVRVDPLRPAAVLRRAKTILVGGPAARSRTFTSRIQERTRLGHVDEAACTTGAAS